MTVNLLTELHWCLNEGFPAEVTEALLSLHTNPRWTISLRQENLQQAYNVWNEWGEQDNDDFIEAVRVVTSLDATFCECGELVWDEDMTVVSGGDQVCQSCIDNHYYHCDSCREWSQGTTDVGGSDYCDDCLSNYCSWCDECDEYVHDGSEHDHNHDCDCEAPHACFEFPADGQGTVRQNERLIVELPKGTIDMEGMELIIALVQRSLRDPRVLDPWIVREVIEEEVGSTWQTKRGNFTRRLSGAFYKLHQVKIAPEVISEVGNIGRAHSSDDAKWLVEFTRDLNLPAEEFYHGDSCWWGGYSTSRCCLKNWGGVGLRTFDQTFENRRYVTGRVWVQPLNAELQPTHDAIGAHAYVVYNGYGELAGYTAARIVAHLTGRSYRRIGFDADEMYVNNAGGYLVADEAICEATESIYLSLDPHDEVDAHNLRVRVSA